MIFAATLCTKLASFRLLTQRVWAFSKPYFASEEKWKARGLLLAIVVLNLSLVYMAVLFNEWNKLFYDSLQDKNAAVF
jgi:vitamin B12/bleomycin/antimicrobial peptide transport system ATP-binding/permease protein